MILRISYKSLIVLFIATVAHADPSPKITPTNPPSPTTQPTPNRPAPTLNNPWLPRLPLTPKPKLPTFTSTTQPAPLPIDRPSLLTLASAVPTPPQLTTSPRLIPQSANALTLRLPNLVQNGRRINLCLAPAPPQSTPPINNQKGDTDFPLLPILTREITIEITPPPAPLPVDQDPYLASPQLSDTIDAPAQIPAPALIPKLN